MRGAQYEECLIFRSGGHDAQVPRRNCPLGRLSPPSRRARARTWLEGPTALRRHRRDLRLRPKRNPIRLQRVGRPARVCRSGRRVRPVQHEGDSVDGAAPKRWDPVQISRLHNRQETPARALTGVAYRLAPKSIIHSWVEVFYDGKWVNLEGFILDAGYLDGVRCLFPDVEGAFCAYAIGTPDIQNPPIE